MRKKEPKNRKIYYKLAFWLGVLVVGTALGLVVQFGRAWVEPTAPAPGGNIAAPINTGAVEQTKTGTVTQKADICVDPNGTGNKICLSNSGGASGAGNCLCYLYGCPLGGGIMMNCGGGWQSASSFSVVINTAAWCSGGFDSPNRSYFRCDSSIGAYNPNFLYGANHTESDCTAAGGEVLTEGSDKFCRMDTVKKDVCTQWIGFFCIAWQETWQCPDGWAQYKNFSETEGKTCNGNCEAYDVMSATLGGACKSCQDDCQTGSHNWQNKSVEMCSFSSYYELWYCDTGDLSGNNCVDVTFGSPGTYRFVQCMETSTGTCIAKANKLGCY